MWACQCGRVNVGVSSGRTLFADCFTPKTRTSSQSCAQGSEDMLPTGSVAGSLEELPDWIHWSCTASGASLGLAVPQDPPAETRHRQPTRPARRAARDTGERN
ncbi:hypothetical protein EYF80_005026 [Liparis tanakae]|uniref:Uncharacterized protein n=1 Tax=Liparis tanakae TaxID=230148 RepID=A0A4Z2J3U0_9TELE|nr:hypothetical protein EYF80_005026 [Liparis tanakae]